MINITQEPNSFHPAYNDSYISFTTSFTENDRAVITLENEYQFTLFPDASGKYLFNMREVIKALINESQFKDTLTTSENVWGYTDSSLYKEITVGIITYGDSTSESISNTYSFNKAVKQYGDREFTNPNEILLPSKDGINYHLTYFEGYPMDITLKYVSNGESIKIKNKNTEQVSQVFTPSISAPYRLLLDTGVNNWGSSNILNTPHVVNSLSVLVNNVVKNQIQLTKKELKCGVYLKWFNSDGSYSYWLFDKWYKIDHRGKEIDRISTNNFNNIYENQQGQNKITGKTGESSIKLKTAVTEEEKNHLISLVTSPHVQMWSENEPFQYGKWLDVKLVSKGFTYVNKKRINQLEVDIELPEVNTQTL